MKRNIYVGLRYLTWLIPKPRHVYYFIIFVCLLMGCLYAVSVNSDDYETAEIFIKNNAQLSSRIGKVNGVVFKFWNGFESVEGEGGQANYSFDAQTANGRVALKVYLIYSNGAWKVKSVEIWPKNGSSETIGVTDG